MSRRITIVGLAALCALALAAVGASGASAAENTAFTCVETAPGAGEFVNADCSATTPGTKSWKHEEIAVNKSTQVQLKATSNAVLESTVGGAAVKLEATEVECMKCMAENRVTAGVMNVFGEAGTAEENEGRLTFKNVSVVGAPKCTVSMAQSPNTAGVIMTEKLKLETGATKEIILSNKAATTIPSTLVLAQFFIKGTECTLNSATAYSVKGDANATTNGSIVTVNVPLGTTLKLGVNNAKLTGTATAEAGETGGTLHPAALT